MTLRRADYLATTKGAVASYVHNSVAPGLGKIGVIVALESGGAAGKLEAFRRELAVDISFFQPPRIRGCRPRQALVDHERAILAEQAKGSGKSANVIKKMVEGRLRKFYEEVVLLAQPFVHDPDLTVEKAVAAAAKEAGAPIKIASFYRFALGEGIDRPDTDFAAEVAVAASGS